MWTQHQQVRCQGSRRLSGEGEGALMGRRPSVRRRWSGALGVSALGISVLLLSAGAGRAAEAEGPFSSPLRPVAPVLLETQVVEGVGAVVIPEPVRGEDLLDMGEVSPLNLEALASSPVPPLMLSELDFPGAEVSSSSTGYTYQVETPQGTFGVSATLTLLDLGEGTAAMDGALGQRQVSFPFSDVVAGRRVLVEVLGHGEGYDAQWYQHGTLYRATLDCSPAFEHPEEAAAQACKSRLVTLLESLRAAPAGNLEGAEIGRRDPRLLESFSQWRQENESGVGFDDGELRPIVDEAFSNPCSAIQSTARSGFSYYPAGCLRVCTGCADSWDFCPGSTITSTCNGGKTGKGSTDTFQLSNLAFPIPEGSAYAQSIYYAPGGAGWFQSAGVTSAPNFQMPWEDNFCEYRGWSVPKCSGGLGHQGQDVRASDNTDNKWWVIAPRGGTVDGTSTSSGRVDIVTEDGQYLFRNLHMHSIQVGAGAKLGMGTRIGKVGNILSGVDGGTLPHLHWELWRKESGVWVRRSPFNSLVAAYGSQWRVQNQAWDNNGSTCRFGFYHDFDFARRVLENRNNNCGSSTFRANGSLNTAYGCTAANPCERVYLDATSGSPNTATTSFDPSLSSEWVGDGRANKRDRIYQVQYDLFRAGYNPSWNLDSVWGPTTKSAVTSFQSCNGLGADGVVGGKSWSLMVSPNKSAGEC